jgi:hypothetical protein
MEMQERQGKGAMPDNARLNPDPAEPEKIWI